MKKTAFVANGVSMTIEDFRKLMGDELKKRLQDAARDAFFAAMNFRHLAEMSEKLSGAENDATLVFAFDVADAEAEQPSAKPDAEAMRNAIQTLMSDGVPRTVQEIRDALGVEKYRGFGFFLSRSTLYKACENGLYVLKPTVAPPLEEEERPATEATEEADEAAPSATELASVGVHLNDAADTDTDI